MPLQFDVLSVNEWTQHLLCAERYQDGRVFIAGDAAHLVIPTGGLGMNTGVGDAIDLGWKLAGTLAGWGGPGLLASYAEERRPIGLRNIQASGAAMAGRDSWRAAWSPEVSKERPEGAQQRAEMARLFDVEQRKVTEILGIEAGYQYVDSPIIWPESGERPDPDARTYVPTSWPGATAAARLAGGWQRAARPPWQWIHVVAPRPRVDADTSSLESALRATGAPLKILDIPDDRPREIYGHDIVLVRPDLHVAWRADAPPRGCRRRGAARHRLD